jgi:prepilin-type N-terminal cleavage/methylation domain-containing protein
MNPRPKGFTLFEMLAVLAIMGVVMTMVSFHLVSLSNIWLNRTDGNFFDQHVEGVTLFLQNALEQSESVSGSLSGARKLPVQWARPPGFDEMDDPLLHFRLKETPALFVAEGIRLPDIQAYLLFHREGLSILWYSSFTSEELEDTEDLRHTPISRFIAKIEYAYYDPEDDEWEITDEPEEDDNEAFILPQYLRLTFRYPPEDLEVIRSIYIPQRTPDLPLF